VTPASGRRRIALAAAGITLAVWVADVVIGLLVDDRLTQVGRADLHQLDGAGVVFLFAEASASLVAVLLLVSRPEHPVGWLFAVLGTSVAAAGATEGYGVLGLLADPGGSYPGAGAAATLASGLFVLWLISIAMVCYLTPTGVHLSPRWAWCARVMWVSGLVWFLTILLSPGELENPFQSVDNPWGVEALHRPLAVLRPVTGFVNNVLVVAAFASLVVRFRRSTGEESRQLMWMGLSALPVPVLFVVTFVAATTGHDELVTLAAAGFVAVLPVSVGLAVAKTRLYDVDRIVARAVAYLLLSGVLAGAYLVTVLLVTDTFDDAARSSTIATAVATLVAAALARPAYRTLQDAVDRRFSRRRYDALRLVREHVASPDPGRTIEQVLQQALRAPDLAVSYWVQDREAWVTGEGLPAVPPSFAMTVARAGRPVARVAAVSVDPALVQAVLREAEPELDNAGLRAAVALQLEEVRASRARLAGAQLEERRRVERDLHDGAQQRLLALAAQLQAALLNGRPERLREALESGVRESQAAVLELRALANGLHPSVLTDGGISAALDDLASRHRVHVDVAEPERRYPPRIEATAWYIACEAVTNALKHAVADLVDVRVDHTASGMLLVVEDDGSGGADPSGSGLRGLADRAEAVGGTLEVRERLPHGTTVTAVLPCGS
jgi:signal transduction histidine kinase